MKNIRLLDCTLRDGGYNNDWNFGHNTLVNVFNRVVSAGIDCIEIGFLDERRDFDINRSIMPDTDSIEKIYGGLKKGNTMVVAMIDYGTCGIENIRPCSESFIDGIRVIFKMHLMHEALDFCRQLKSLGYKVFTQAVSFTTYSDEKIKELVSLVNEVKPYAVSVVDTYGLMFRSDLFHYYEMVDKYLDPDIAFGYHAHNNFQLAFSNCIELANLHAGKPRTLLLDGSIYGMGKGCGNAPLELLAMYMNGRFDSMYDLSQILEAIDVNVSELYRQYHWGYSLKGFVAASNDCHPNYVSYLLDKKTLSLKSIDEILKMIVEEKRLLYDKGYIERLYQEYQKNTWDDTKSYMDLASELSNNNILILGPGVTIIEEKEVIDAFIKRYSPLIISINYLPEYWKSDFLFITNSKRYVQQSAAINKLGDTIKIMATSNVTKAEGQFDYIMDYESLIDPKAVFADNSFIMLLKILEKVGVKQVAVAGFDGYSSNRESNYYISKMEYDFAKQKGNEINEYVNTFLGNMKDKLSVDFITSTNYKV